MTEVERTDEVLRQHQQEAEDAAKGLATALQLNGIPELVSLHATGRAQGAHVYLGGCSARTAREVANALMVYARYTGRLIDGDSSSKLHALMADSGVTPALPSDGVIVLQGEWT